MSVDVLQNTPSFEHSAILTIGALAPLSMVVQMPGKLYRTQAAPTHGMLYGLFENALGWHLGRKDREELIKAIQRRHNIASNATEAGGRFISLLQFHLRFGLSIAPADTDVLRYNDYWSQHLRTNGTEFVGGSREYDSQAIAIMDAVSRKEQDPERVTVDERKQSRKDANAVHTFQGGDKVHVSVLRPYFPRYYVTPIVREYVIPHSQYQYRVETSNHLASLLTQSLRDPVAPLYLGSNDGWVEVEWRTIPRDSQ